MHTNDNAREAKPGWWIFRGPIVGFVPLAVLASICIFMIASRSGLEWWSALIVSTLPCLSLLALVYFVLNGRPDSYLFDLMSLFSWRFKCWLYYSELVDRPPILWLPSKSPRHPTEFNMENVP